MKMLLLSSYLSDQHKQMYSSLTNSCVLNKLFTIYKWAYDSSHFQDLLLVGHCAVEKQSNCLTMISSYLTKALTSKYNHKENLQPLEKNVRTCLLNPTRLFSLLPCDGVRKL